MYNILIVTFLLSCSFFKGVGQSIADLPALDTCVSVFVSDTMRGRRAVCFVEMKASNYTVESFKRLGALAFSTDTLSRSSEVPMCFGLINPVPVVNVGSYGERNFLAPKMKCVVEVTYFPHWGYLATCTSGCNMLVRNWVDHNVFIEACMPSLVGMYTGSMLVSLRRELFSSFPANDCGLLPARHALGNLLSAPQSVIIILNGGMERHLACNNGRLVLGASWQLNEKFAVNPIVPQILLATTGKRVAMFCDVFSCFVTFHSGGLSYLLNSACLNPPYHQPEATSYRIDFDDLEQRSFYTYTIVDQMANATAITFRPAQEAFLQNMNNLFLN